MKGDTSSDYVECNGEYNIKDDVVKILLAIVIILNDDLSYLYRFDLHKDKNIEAIHFELKNGKNYHILTINNINPYTREEYRESLIDKFLQWFEF